MTGTVDTAGNVTMPASVDVNGVAVAVAQGDSLCPDCLQNGFRRTIAGHKHDSAAKPRTGESCPLCGGKFHGREGKEYLSDFACAWRQWAKSLSPARDERGIAVIAPNVQTFHAWLAANPTLQYGKRAQYNAWQQMMTAGTWNGTLSAPMAADMDRHINPKRGAKVGASDPNGPALPGVSSPPLTVAPPAPVVPTVRTAGEVLTDIVMDSLPPEPVAPAKVTAPAMGAAVKLTAAQEAAIQAKLAKLAR